MALDKRSYLKMGDLLSQVEHGSYQRRVDRAAKTNGIKQVTSDTKADRGVLEGDVICDIPKVSKLLRDSIVDDFVEGVSPEHPRTAVETSVEACV